MRVSSLCNLIDAKETYCATLCDFRNHFHNCFSSTVFPVYMPSSVSPSPPSTQHTEGGGFGRVLLPGPRSVTVSTSPARCYPRVCRGGNISVRPPQSQSHNEKTHAHYVSTHGTKLDHKWMNMMLHMLMFRDILMDCLSVFLYETLHLRPVIHQGRSKC